MEDPKQGLGSEWTTGLFDCNFQDVLCVGYGGAWMYGRMMEILDNGTTTCCNNGLKYTAVALIYMPCVLSCSLRKKLRAKYNLPEGHGDFCTHFWCEGCALWQEYREMRNRGLDPALGWAHYAKQAGSTQMSAMPADQVMTKEI